MLTDTNLNGHRTDGVWRHTGKLIVASNLELYPPEQPPGQSATLVLPNGIITTPMLAPNAVQQLIGYYFAATTWTLPQTNVWTETPIQVNCTFSGVSPVRLEFNFSVTCPTKGQRLYWGFFLDGSLGTGIALGVADAPENGYLMSCTGTYYSLTPPTGTHRVAMGLYGPTGAALSSQLADSLYVTEQKR